MIFNMIIPTFLLLLSIDNVIGCSLCLMALNSFYLLLAFQPLRIRSDKLECLVRAGRGGTC